LTIPICSAQSLPGFHSVGNGGKVTLHELPTAEDFRFLPAGPDGDGRLYSGSGADTPDYAVGYATADSPLGPFTRAQHNPIIQRSEGLFGPGHGCAIQDAVGRWWHIYHQKTTARVEWDRFIALDPLSFDQDGQLHGQATRGTPRPAPTRLNR
jgi:hypothetical protein